MIETDGTTENDKVIIEKLYHENGALYQESPIDIENRIHGIQRLYRNNGLLWSEHSYKHGVKDGAEKLYRDNGELYEINIYKNGVQVNKSRSDLAMDYY